MITGTLSNMWEIPVSEESPPDKRGMYGGIATLLSLLPLWSIIGDDIAESLGWQWSYGIFFFIIVILMIMWFKFQEPKRWIDAKEDRGHELLKVKKAIKSLTRKDATYVAISTIVYTIWSVSFIFARGCLIYFYAQPIVLNGRHCKKSKKSPVPEGIKTIAYTEEKNILFTVF